MDRLENRRKHMESIGKLMKAKDPESDMFTLKRMPLGDAIPAAFLISIFVYALLIVGVDWLFSKLFSVELALAPLGGAILTTIAAAVFLLTLHILRKPRSTTRQLEREMLATVHERRDENSLSPTLRFSLRMKKYLIDFRGFWAHTLLLVTLSLALLEWSDYGVYNLIRLVVCSTSVWLAFKSEKNGNIQKAWIFGVMAATFNPFLPLQLGREVWIWVDWFSILVVVGDLICLSSPPIRKKLSTLLCASVVFWGLFLGVKYYSVEVLLPHSKAAAEKREAEERLELDRLMGELPSWDSPRRPPIELLPNVDYSK